MLKNKIILLVLIPLLAACKNNTDPDLVEKIDLPDVGQELKLTIEEYLKNHYMSPEDYVISKFNDHDIIFIGEFHRIKHDLEFIHNLIPLLYENDIFFLGTEFARREDQYLIDSLLNGQVYDESLAGIITFNFLVPWGLQEYLDIYRVAWQLNRTIPGGSRKFRILGLNDSPDWSLVKTQEDLKNNNIMRQVWSGCSEKFWADVILDEVVAKGEKALIYSGIHHAFTEYRQPLIDEEKLELIGFYDARMGNFVYNVIGKRAITIFLHAPWVSAQGYNESPVYPADGIIDAVMPEISLEDRRIGFDTKDTPLGKLTGETSLYKFGYSNFTLDMFCDGYIYQMPLSEYRGVTPIKDFVNEGNIEQARLRSPNPDARNASIDYFFNADQESSDMAKRFACFW